MLKRPITAALAVLALAGIALTGTIDPTSGVELQKIIAEVYKTPESVVAEARDGLKGYKKFKTCKGKYCKKKKKKKKS